MSHIGANGLVHEALIEGHVQLLNGRVGDLLDLFIDLTGAGPLCILIFQHLLD